MFPSLKTIVSVFGFNAVTFEPKDLNSPSRFIFKDIKTNHIVSADWDVKQQAWIVPFPGSPATMELPPPVMKERFTFTGFSIPSPGADMRSWE